MTKPIHPFDSPEKIAVFLKYLKCLDLSNEKFDNITNLIDVNLGIIPFSGICIKKGTELYRARKQPLFNDEMFQNISELTIREDFDIKNFGRANIPNQAIFYCSLDKWTAAREVTQWQMDDTGALIKKGIYFSNPFTQFMTISKWVTKEDLYFFTVFEDNTLSDNIGYNDQIIHHYKSRYDFDINRYKMSLELVRSFFNSEFVKSEINGQFDYYYSAYYSHLIYKFSELSPVAGFIYLSVAFDLEGYNFAIPRNKLNKIEFVSADYCYTYNSNGKSGFENYKIVIAADSRATLQVDNTLKWIDVWGKD